MFLIMLTGVLKYFSVHLIRNAHEKKKKKEIHMRRDQSF